MGKILLDYVFPISVVPSIPAASTAFLKQVCVVAKPKSGQESNVGKVFECTSMSQVATRTDNENAEQLFNAGMSKVYVLLANDLDLAEALESEVGRFWTLLISDDFVDADFAGVSGSSPAVKAEKKIQDILYRAKTPGTPGNSITIVYTDDNSDGEALASVANSTEITVSIEDGVTTAATIAAAIAESTSANALVECIVDSGDEADPQIDFTPAQALAGGTDAVTGDSLDVGAFDGVVGLSSEDVEFLSDQAAIENRSPFFAKAANGAKNMFYAFGKLLSNLVNWTNQQYISMPFNDEVDELGEANSLFDDKVSFVINDTEFGNRLALFAVGGKAIVAPYIAKNLRIDLQSRALQWIAANQPAYTLTNAALLEQRLQEDVINQRYIATQWISAGVVDVRLEQDNFVASGYIDIAEPKALWRMFGEMRSTL